MDQEAINRFNEQQAEAQEKAQLLQTIETAGDKVATAVIQTERNTKKVTVTNDLAKPSDIEKVVEAVKAIDLKPQDLQPLADELKMVGELIAKLPTEYPDFPVFPEAPEQREDVKVTNLNELKDYFQDVVKAVSALETSIKFDPTIEVKPADVKVTEQKIDLTPVTKGLASLEKAFKAIKTPNFDTKDIIKGLDKVSGTVNNLSFPVPNYVLPFKGGEGEATQVQLENGVLPTSSPSQAVRIDDTTAADTTYIGKAPIGSATSSAVWQIKKLNTSSGVIITWADGDALFDNVFDDRASLTYN